MNKHANQPNPYGSVDTSTRAVSPVRLHLHYYPTLTHHTIIIRNKTDRPDITKDYQRTIDSSRLRKNVSLVSE